ncbi:MAG: dihydrolipoyl dehydrogenase family protein [Candidatus Saccharimonadales bacterium]
MARDYDYQLIVIGAGSGGLVAAELAAKLGARVALVEAENGLGGECLNSGCVPSKALIFAAREVWRAGQLQKFGLSNNAKPDFGLVRRHLKSSIATIREGHDNDNYYQKLGVDVYHGTAEFLGHKTIRAGGKTLRGRRFIIATGSAPAIPDIPGLKGGEFLTNESIFEIDNLPASLAVIGGGPIGCELGQAFAMLGSKVTILQGGDRLLERDEPEAAQILSASLRAMGVTIELNARIEKINYGAGSLSLKLKDHTIKADKLLVAAGRRARMPGGLELAGIKTNDRGIIVNARWQTNQRHIYAIGDCNGGPKFTHAAANQATLAVQHALLHKAKKFKAAKIPWTTFTTPEIAHFGQTKAQLDKRQTNYQTIRADYKNIDKAITESESGFIEILLGNSQKILAASVVGHNAGEILAQIMAAKSWTNLNHQIQAYPTYASGLQQMAAEANLQNFLSGTVGALARRYIKRHN